MTDVDDSNHANGSSPSVGDRLRLAREAKKITVAEVVVQLRLTKENVAYLESDQWDKLHGRPYARGYFSSYVNFLGLPHTEMLALFNLEYTSTEPSIDGFRRSDAKGKSSGSWFNTLLLIIVIGAAAWFGYQYWLDLQGQSIEAEHSISPSFESNQSAEDSFSASIVEPLPAVESEQINFDETNEIIEDQSTIIVVDKVFESLAETEGIEESSQVVNQDVLTNDELILEEEKVMPVAQVLLMHFSEDCWVEVKDRNNRKLLHEIVSANDTVELAGEWPLQVLLGNAAAVAVRYNNAEFDIASYVRTNVARFTVGEATE